MKALLARVKDFIAEERGNVSVMFAGGLVAFLMSAALVTDVGHMYVRQQEVQNALDAAALAGIQKIFSGEEAAMAEAEMYVDVNGGTITESFVDEDELEMELIGREAVPYWFARAIGKEEGTVAASAMAKAGTLVAMNGLVPIAIPDQEFTYGASYRLNMTAGQGYSGNYGYLDFSGRGASSLGENIRYGFEGVFEVGDEVPTKPGINHGPVESAIDYRIEQDEGDLDCQSFESSHRGCNRIIFMPVIDDLDLNGKSTVTIVGFAAFFLEGASGGGGHMRINGRFVRMIAPGEMGAGTNYGVYTVKLTH